MLGLRQDQILTENLPANPGCLRPMPVQARRLTNVHRCRRTLTNGRGQVGNASRSPRTSLSLWIDVHPGRTLSLTSVGLRPCSVSARGLRDLHGGREDDYSYLRYQFPHGMSPSVDVCFVGPFSASKIYEPFQQHHQDSSASLLCLSASLHLAQPLEQDACCCQGHV